MWGIQIWFNFCSRSTTKDFTGFQSGQTHLKWVKLALKPRFFALCDPLRPSNPQNTFIHPRYHAWLSAGTLWGRFQTSSCLQRGVRELKVAQIGAETDVFVDFSSRNCICSPEMANTPPIPWRHFSWSILGLVSTFSGQPGSTYGSQTLGELCRNARFCNFVTRKSNLSPSIGPHTFKTVKNLELEHTRTGFDHFWTARVQLQVTNAGRTVSKHAFL